ncbi:MAG: PEP-CTERM sorting domain-containing protein [Planctomycetaceae bacterium]|nr:PEP-CTERM sorting domain-containing protein [Planctomycetaceae bacterium]
MPTSQDDDTFIFENVISGGYFDPIAADRYDFQMLDGSLFTSIDELPSFLVNPVTVLSGTTVLGQYGAGESVDFSALGGVSSFSILGINPTVNGDDPLAFPIKLSFNNAIADFSMTPISSGVQPVPEPSSLALLSIGGLIGTMRLRRLRAIRRV